MTLPTVFIKQVTDELKKVAWPTRAEITRLTISVIIISAAVGIFLSGVDLLLTKVMEVAINK